MLPTCSSCHKERFYNIVLPRLYKRLRLGKLDSHSDECLLRTLEVHPQFGTFARELKWTYDISLMHSGPPQGRRFYYLPQQIEKRRTDALAILSFCPHVRSLELVITVYSTAANADGELTVLPPESDLPAFATPTPPEIQRLPCYSSLRAFSFTPDHQHMHTPDLWPLIEAFLEAPNMLNAYFPKRMWFPAVLDKLYNLKHLHLSRGASFPRQANYPAIWHAYSNLISFSCDLETGWPPLLNIYLPIAANASTLKRLVFTDLEYMRVFDALLVPTLASRFPACESLALCFSTKQDWYGTDDVADFIDSLPMLFPDDLPCLHLAHLTISCGLSYAELFACSTLTSVLSRFCSRHTFPVLKRFVFRSVLDSMPTQLADNIVEVKMQDDSRDGEEDLEYLIASQNDFMMGYRRLMQEMPEGLEIVLEFERGETGIKSLSAAVDGSVVVEQW